MLRRKKAVPTNRNGKNKEDDFVSGYVDHWKEMVGGFLAGFFRGVTDSLVTKAKEEVDNITKALKKNIVGLVIFLAGITFMLVGLAKFINEMVGMGDGIGYAGVGFLALILGYIIIKK